MLYVDLMQGFGWTWEYVDELDFPRVDSIYKGWRRKPPVHWTMMWWVGYKPPQTSAGDGKGGSAADGPSPSAMFSSLGNQLLDG